MRSVSGVDLVSAALNTSLSHAQKRFNLSNPGSIAKRKLKKQKKLETKLKKTLARFSKKAGESSSGTSLDGLPLSDWCASFESNEFEFVPVQNQFSSFISKLKEKYTCLNPQRKTNIKDKKKKKVKKGVVGKKEKISRESKLLPPTNSGITSEKDDDVDSGLGLEEIFPTNTALSLLQQLRLKRLKARKERKRKKKEAKTKALEDQRQKLLKLQGTNKKSKRMNDILITPTAPESNGKATCEKNQIPQLPQPKHILYPREKIVQGWKQKYYYGSGFINLGNSCYMNATLQALFHTPSFFNWLISDEDHVRVCRSNSQTFQQCLVCAMASTLKDSLNRQHQAIRPILIHSKLKVICKHFTHCRQEDAHEFLRYLLESMERSYLAARNALRIDNRSRETTPLGQIFGGYLRTEVTCLKCNNISTTFQPLAELQLDIRHVTTLDEALSNHFKKERLDNNDYKCEKCHTMSPATKQFSLEVPPIVLCLQLKRFTLSGGKINKPIHCNQRLNLNRLLHKSLRLNHANVQYRLVALVTHIGSSPNCGHYTSIAEASNGNFYQFDDNYVRTVSIQTALNTDAYVIIYEMEPNSQGLKSNAPLANGSSTLSSPLSNGIIKPSATITKSENSTPLLEHKKLLHPFLKTTPSKPSENGAVRIPIKSPSTTPRLNGFNSLNSLTGKERTPLSFNIQKSAAGTGSSNPKILFKNPSSVIPNTSSYITNPSPYKLSPAKEELSNGKSDKINDEKSKFKPKPFVPEEHTLEALSRFIKEPSAHSKLIASLGVKTGSVVNPPSVKITTNKKLVAYDSDDESDEKSIPDDVAKEEVETEKSSSPNPSKKLFPIFKTTPNIKSWNGAESVLSNSIDASRKRSLEKSKEDLHNEELDMGRTKKARSDSKSKSRSPSCDSSRHSDKSSSSSNGVNKFQRYEDNRRTVGEHMQALQQRSAITAPISKSTATPGKAQNGFHSENGHSDGGSRRNSNSSFESNEGNTSSSSTSRGNHDYFAKKGYNYKTNYGYDNFKKHHNSNYHSTYNGKLSHNNNNNKYGGNSYRKSNYGRNDRNRFGGNNKYYKNR